MDSLFLAVVSSNVVVYRAWVNQWCIYDGLELYTYPHPTDALISTRF